MDSNTSTQNQELFDLAEALKAARVYVHKAANTVPFAPHNLKRKQDAENVLEMVDGAIARAAGAMRREA